MTLNYIEWYVVELGRNLSDSIPLEKRNSLLHESKNHLTSLVEEFRDQGMDEKESQIAAIDRFGTPADIATQFVDTFQNNKRRPFMAMLNVLLFLGITAVVFGLVISPAELVHHGIEMAVVAFGTLFGLYSLLRGRRVSAKWLLVPTAMSFVIGVPTAYFLTSYVSEGGSRQTVIPYKGLQKQVLNMRTEMVARNKAIRPYMAAYRSALKDPKYANGLKAGETFSVPSYRCIAGSKGIYVVFLPPMKPTMRVASDPYRIDLQGNEFSIGAIADRKPELLAGPMSGHDFRNYFAERLSSEARGRSMDDSAMTQLQDALNTSVLQRIKLFAWWVAAATLLFGVPAGWVASWIAVSVRNLFRFRTRRVRLA